MARDQYESDEGGFLVDRYGRRQYRIVGKHATPAATDVQRGYTPTDADGREQIVMPDLIAPDGSFIPPVTLPASVETVASDYASGKILSRTSPATVTVPPDFPATAVLDNFNRANENPLSDGGNWTEFLFYGQPLQLVSNQAKGQVPPTTPASYWVPSTFTDCEVYCDVVSFGDGGIDLILRINPADNSNYFCTFTPTGFTLYRSPLGSTTIISSGTATISPGDTIGLRAIGSVISVWVKHNGIWDVLDAETDTSVTGAGHIGLGTEDTATSSVMDNFGGGAVSLVTKSPGTLPVHFDPTPNDGQSWNLLIGSDMPNVALGVEGVMDGKSNVAFGGGRISAFEEPITGNLGSITTGYDNVAVGAGTLLSATTGHTNVGVGADALSLLVDGFSNVAVGAQCAENVVSGFNNTCVGVDAFSGLGNSNTAIGTGSLGSLTDTSSLNVGCGAATLNQIPSGTGNTAVGTSANTAPTSAINYTTALGCNTTAGADGAVAIGTDHTGAGASISTQDVIALGTANHQVKISKSTTGAKSAALGSNGPMVTATAPYTWFTMMSSDGSTVYVPAWK